MKMLVNLSEDLVYPLVGKGNDAWRKTGRGSPSHYSRKRTLASTQRSRREREGMVQARGNRRNINKPFPPGTSDVV